MKLIKKIAAFFVVRIESIIALFATMMIGYGVMLYSKRIALIVVGSLILADVLFDRIMKGKQ